MHTLREPGSTVLTEKSIITQDPKLYDQINIK
jgi:hypothetical protein